MSPQYRIKKEIIEKNIGHVGGIGRVLWGIFKG